MDGKNPNCKYGHWDCMPCTNCDAYIPTQTNADRIRAMTDEELADLFTRTVADGCPPNMDWDCKKDDGGWDACDECWCKWLQQPAED